MEADLTIISEGFHTNEDARIVGSNTLTAIKNLSQSFELDITGLKKVVISSDFPTALHKITEGYSHNLPCSYTSTKQGIATAQLVSKINDQGFCAEYTLVLSTNFFSEWLDREGKVHTGEYQKLRPVLHRIHHELVHVHEKNTTPNLNKSMRIYPYDDATLMLATSAWSEYLANSISAITAPSETVEEFVKYFNVVLNEVPVEICYIINEYLQEKISLFTMFTGVKQRVKLITNACAYAMGYLHSLNIDVRSYASDLNETISNQKFGHLLKELAGEFEMMTDRYTSGSINGYEDFDRIVSAIKSLYESFGLHLVRTELQNDSDLYVNVRISR